MLAIRTALFVGWLVILASLFWDPFSSRLTEPTASWSPWRITVAHIALQQRDIAVTPYPVGNRLFWTVILPIVPLFLMLFGHEAWRRICPLSFASQLPRYLRLQRRRKGFRRATKTIEWSPYLIDPKGWLARNSWYVQFFLLFTGVCARLLVINSGRIGLAVAFLTVIALAITVGALWGGKTWCNYVCPANIVQRIYTEPRGLLESAPHVTKDAVSQSMCRSSSPSGDVSACVACTRGCGDIDLERSYWDTIEKPERRNTYFMFFGLIIGFYGYYYVYAGDWTYYFSGIWTHEGDQLASLMDPGFYALGAYYSWIPKLVAAPLTLAFCCVCALALGRLLASAYMRIQRRRTRLPEAVLINHCLAMSSYVSLNTFYVFGGRPNLLLLPGYGIWLVDFTILALSSVWLVRTLQRTPSLYRREGLAASMIGQLKKMNLDLGNHFEGRQIEDLRLDEVYVLSKVLPSFTAREKLAAYRHVIEEAIATNRTSSPRFLDALRDFRIEMGITDEEHLAALEELRDHGEVNLEPIGESELEREICRDNYYSILAPALAEQIEAGQSIDAALCTTSVAATVTILRNSFQISDAEHVDTLERLTGADGLLVERAKAHLDTMRDADALKLFLNARRSPDAFGSALHRLVRQALDAHLLVLGERFLAVARATGPSTTMENYAASLTDLIGDAAPLLLSRSLPNQPYVSWRDVLAPSIAEALSAALGSHGAPPQRSPMLSPHSLVDDENLSENQFGECLLRLLGVETLMVAPLSLAALGFIHHAQARRLAARMAAQGGPSHHWLMTEVIEHLIGETTTSDEPAASAFTLRIDVIGDGLIPYTVNAVGQEISIGRAPSNAFTISNSSVAPYHLVLRRGIDTVRVVRVDGSELLVDGAVCETGCVDVGYGSVVSLGSPAAGSVALRLRWAAARGNDETQAWDTVTKMVWLSRFPRFRPMSVAELAEIATAVVIRRYRRDAIVQPDTDMTSRTVLVQHGLVAPIDAVDGVPPPSARPGPDERTKPSEPFAASVYDPGHPPLRVISEFAILILVPVVTTSLLTGDPEDRAPTSAFPAARLEPAAEMPD